MGVSSSRLVSFRAVSAVIIAPVELSEAGGTRLECACMTKQPNDPEAVRKAQVRQLFRVHYPNSPTVKDVVSFYAWLGIRRPGLLRDTEGGSYTNLKFDLDGLYQK